MKSYDSNKPCKTRYIRLRLRLLASTIHRHRRSSGERFARASPLRHTPNQPGARLRSVPSSQSGCSIPGWVAHTLPTTRRSSSMCAYVPLYVHSGTKGPDFGLPYLQHQLSDSLQTSGNQPGSLFSLWKRYHNSCSISHCCIITITATAHRIHNIDHNSTRKHRFAVIEQSICCMNYDTS